MPSEVFAEVGSNGRAEVGGAPGGAIVVVDDTAGNRELFGYWLRHAGYDVFEATRGDDGLELVHRVRPDLVVLDVNLPDLSGLEVCRRLKDDPETESIPVLQVSAAATESDDRSVGLESGADAYVVTPVPARELLAVVRSLLRMRRAEETARRDAERWRAAFDTAATGMALLDPAGARFLQVNHVLCDTLGRSEEALLELSADDVTHPDDMDLTRHAINELVQGARASTLLEKRYVRPDGRVVWALAGHTLMRSRDGFPQAIVLHVHDVTARRAAELALEEARAAAEADRRAAERAEADVRFRALVDGAPDGIVVTDSGGMIRIVNRQVEAMFGYGRVDLIGRPLEVLLPSRFQHAHVAHRAAYVTDPTTRRMGVGLDLAARRRDGSEFPVDVKLSPLEIDGRLFVSASVRDATDRIQAEADRVRLEERLRRSERLESLGQLAGGVAHDFNNLLAVILNYAGFVSGTLEPDSQPAADLGEIRRAAERAAALTRQLLIFGRREIMHPEPVNLNDVVVELERLVSRTIGEHIEVRVDLDPLLSTVTVDRSGIDQVLMNLVLNARDAMPGGGRIVVETRNVDLTAADSAAFAAVASGRYVRVTVTDDGPGMEPDVAARAFEPFFTTKPRGQGTGLGLATVYGVVAQSGGEVHLYSTPGQGTVVRVYLPYADSLEAVPSEMGPPEAPEATGQHVLVVEDEPAVRELTRRVLTEHGYEVTVASDGEAALAACATLEGLPDLVLTDVVMPKVSGKDLADRLRAKRPGLPVLFMSGYPLDVMSVPGPGNGAFLQKPFDAATLLRRVAGALSPSQEGSAP